VVKLQEILNLLHNKVLPFIGSAVGLLFAINIKTFAYGMLALLILVIIDQITGVWVSLRNKTFSTKLLVSKTVKKLFTYFMILLVLGISGFVLKSIAGGVGLAVGFVAFGYGIVLIVVAEVWSIIENLQTLGYTIKVGKTDVFDSFQKKLEKTIKDDEIYYYGEDGGGIYDDDDQP